MVLSTQFCQKLNTIHHQQSSPPPPLLPQGLPHRHLAVFLKDTSAADLTSIIEFMYRGSVNVLQSRLASFIRTAEMLQVRGLSGDEEKVRGGGVGSIDVDE